MKSTAVIGAAGQLGSRLCEMLGSHAVPLTREVCDVTDAHALLAWLGANRPAAIINASAYTNVEKAEEEGALADRINRDAPQLMARWAAQHTCPFIHISTDYVFDGSKGHPYTEMDTTHPINRYGQSKAEGEGAVMEANADALVLRISWLYDGRGKNFFTTIADKLLAGNPLTVVADQHGTPCYAPDIAEAIVMLLQKPLPKGILHMVQEGHTSWYGFACTIKEEMETQLGKPLPQIVPIDAASYPTRAKRPADSRLDASRLYSVSPVRLATWQDAVKRAVKERYAD